MQIFGAVSDGRRLFGMNGSSNRVSTGCATSKASPGQVVKYQLLVYFPAPAPQ
jgi:hypothetical protein